ncbi:hypothetical protein ASPWEDRAFT_23675 [Aspergillus wentii DTO 134E9]|uniref:Ubiquitin interaction motif protein n=1 Tax=Aspergillus wentii DTO 134E9 TaxID=1073089 RepID=A0A1L9S380_ASPWE|nr:uncharacterized protein ASPWEDRAFT_23675 [Aspergillus wentii DTO 134E9]KAI9929947.1 hypothetical protein MW887_011757 [Aspergillus wentii]OJJ41600.1 hypothetical protein ASPWEDRAFT_23675 [Aspergillus wentii DTO 134E9]
MTSEPTEEAITNFVSFTSTSREQAISFLKANDLNSNKAINAYFEDPTGPQTQTTSYQNDPAFKIEHSDPVASAASAAPPSRPPSRLNLNDPAKTTQQQGGVEASAPSTKADNKQGLTLAEREERELQQAVAMSLNPNLGQQETGVTGTGQSSFGKATRDNYDDGEWAMTLFDSSAREIIISPDPGERKRVDNEPAFIRPSQDSLHLGGLLTILHSIPLAREALLLRNRVLSDYGHDSQWWNGQPINLPKIVTIQDAQDGDTDWDDILHETQRLIAFLDSTDRAFGSSDALASLKSMSTFSSEGSIGKFLESWQESAVRADPENQLATIFQSKALKRPLSVYDEPVEKEFSNLEAFVEPEHGQTLYDVLDRTMWSDRPGEELDDVWLEHIAEVFTIKLEGSTQSVDVKIPAVFYPDRYLASCRDLARDFRTQRLQIFDEVYKMERLMNHFNVSKSAVIRGLTSKEILEKAAAAAPLLLPKSVANGANGLSLTPEESTAEAQRLANELKTVSDKIEAKLKELELRKQSAMETLRGYSKMLTEPSTSPAEPPHHAYTLRGVCTEPHVTYVLRRRGADGAEDAMDTAENEWQWWRISFSTDDAKTRQAESNTSSSSASKNADVIGYTARKVREVEVLRAAREESNTALLVYANNNALGVQEEPIPPQLKNFVDIDNRSFEAEFQDAEDFGHQGEGGNSQDVGSTNPDQGLPKAGPEVPPRPNVNVFDYEVRSFDDEEKSGQEMEERTGGGLLSHGGMTATGQPSGSAGPDWDEIGDGETSHIEQAK